MWYVIAGLALLVLSSGGSGSSTGTGGGSPPKTPAPAEPEPAAPSGKVKNVVNSALDVIDAVAALVNSRR